MPELKTVLKTESKKDPVKRTGEIEEFTNLHIIHPISGWLVPKFAARNITPNMVSLFGMACGILSAIAYYHYASPLMAMAGFAGMILWHIMDGADGQLARLTKSYSETGKILDGICDYVTFISVYVALALALIAEGKSNVWAIVLTSGLLHAIQSSAYEMQRSAYDYWGYGKQSAAIPELKQMIAELEGKSALSYIMGQFHIVYIRMQRLSSGINAPFRKSLREALDNNPHKAAQIRELYRKVFAPGVNRWSLLCANYRTIAIFIACILGQPLYFFWFEIAVLTPIMLLLIHKQRLINQLFTLRLKEI